MSYEYIDRETAEYDSIIESIERLCVRLEEQSRQIKRMREELLEEMKFALIRDCTYNQLNN